MGPAVRLTVLSELEVSPGIPCLTPQRQLLPVLHTDVTTV